MMLCEIQSTLCLPLTAVSFLSFQHWTWKATAVNEPAPWGAECSGLISTKIIDLPCTYRVVFNYSISCHWGDLCVAICMAYCRINSLSTQFIYSIIISHPSTKNAPLSVVLVIFVPLFSPCWQQACWWPSINWHVWLRVAYLSNCDKFHPHH